MHNPAARIAKPHPRDPEFGRGKFKIGYPDYVRNELVYVPLAVIPERLYHAKSNAMYFHLADFHTLSGKRS